MRQIFVGCCGWAVRGGRKAYFSKFPVIELQETFYKLPRMETAKRWSEEAPADFIFCMKAWQAVSHPVTSPTWRRSGMKKSELEKLNYGFLRPVKENFDAWDMTAEIAKTLKARFVVVQTPPTMPVDQRAINDVIKFFDYATASGLNVGWEPRGRLATLTNVVEEICSKTGVIHVCDLLRAKPVTISDMLYTRLHGLGGKEVNYSYKYSDEDLKRLVSVIEGFDVREAYVLFNNISMAEDAERFSRLVEKFS